MGGGRRTIFPRSPARPPLGGGARSGGGFGQLSAASGPSDGRRRSSVPRLLGLSLRWHLI